MINTDAYEADILQLQKTVHRLSEMLDDYRRFHTWISEYYYDLIIKWDKMESEKE
tara:strand:+ start:52 stop:216 length:165 start_codon:yes stop_codon:yes gene_type:complete